METVVKDFMKAELSKHVLIQELDTPKYKAFWMMCPSNGRMMSTRIIFTPEGIALMGDNTPSQRGNVSYAGYDLEWFAGSLSERYLASKFLTKSLQPEEVTAGIREWIKNREYYNFTDDQVEELTEIADELESHDIGTDEAHRRVSDVDQGLVDDGLPWCDYDANEWGWLCAIQQRFAELYNNPASTQK